MAPRAFEPLQVPDGFWQRTDVQQALRQRDIGAVFRLLSKHTGAGQTRIGIAVGMSQGQVSVIMSPGTHRQRVTTLDVLLRIADGLDMPAPARRLLGLAGDPHSDAAPLPGTLSVVRFDKVTAEREPHSDNGQTPPADEFDAYELARRVSASDVGSATLTGLEQAADRLAIAYQGTSPAALLPDVRRHLHYVGQLIDKRATLEQRRRLLVVGGWLSLLASTLQIDLHQRSAADAWLTTAASLAEETGHNEILGWCLETRAWDALTEAQFKLAADLSKAAQEVAPHDGSAFIQATAQEGRAWARLGETRAARNALKRVEQLASPLAIPDQPEHHYRYDPAKQLAYTVTTLSWLDDPAAERYAREVLARLESGQDGGIRPRRIATARLDLALTLTHVGDLDEAAGQATTALRSGRIVPSSAWRAAEILTAVQAADLGQAAELHEAYEAALRSRGQVPPGP
jgi:hypothetical protein